VSARALPIARRQVRAKRISDASSGNCAMSTPSRNALRCVQLVTTIAVKCTAKLQMFAVIVRVTKCTRYSYLEKPTEFLDFIYGYVALGCWSFIAYALVPATNSIALCLHTTISVGSTAQVTPVGAVHGMPPNARLEMRRARTLREWSGIREVGWANSVDFVRTRKRTFAIHADSPAQPSDLRR